MFCIQIMDLEPRGVWLSRVYAYIGYAVSGMLITGVIDIVDTYSQASASGHIHSRPIMCISNDWFYDSLDIGGLRI